MKPIVHYDPNYPVAIEVGCSAFVKPVDHPGDGPGQMVTNTKMILTSMVISAMSDGCFETLNTRYVPRRTLQ